MMGEEHSSKIAPPPPGKLYHGVYPGGPSGEEDDFTAADLRRYEQLAGCRAAWVYFSNNWYRDRSFPAATAAWIRETGAAPFIRLMLRSTSEQYRREKLFTLQNIIEGRFDSDLQAWAGRARDFGSALIVEYGTEVNGDWFPWNGRWNGGAATQGFGDPKKADGPERFVAAYRHIVQVIRNAGARNITWVFHVDVGDSPEAGWNRFENYYPGDDVVDWVGVSCYGLQKPTEDAQPESFRERLDPVYPRLVRMAPSKPILVCEFGATAGNPRQRPDQWADQALRALLERSWPAIAGFAWWNEAWENDDNPKHNTTMRLQDIPALAEVFKRQLRQHVAQVQSRPVFAK